MFTTTNKKTNITINVKKDSGYIAWVAQDNATGEGIISSGIPAGNVKEKVIGKWLAKLDMAQLKARAFMDSQEYEDVVIAFLDK